MPRDLSQYPDWPAYMKKATAAAYCDLSEYQFGQWVDSGLFPPPCKKQNRTELWSKAEIDKARVDVPENDPIKQWVGGNYGSVSRETRP